MTLLYRGVEASFSPDPRALEQVLARRMAHVVTGPSKLVKYDAFIENNEPALS